MRRLHLACTAVLAAIAPASAETGGSFRDWAMTCTPGLRCTASTFAQGDGGLVGLGLERSAAAEAPVVLDLSFAGDAAPSGEVTVSVDGAEALRLPASAFTTRQDGHAMSDDPRIGGELLGRLRDGRSATVTARTEAGAVERTFSLAGLVATLRKMDEDQGRIGTGSALIDRGSQPLPDRTALPADIAAPDDLPVPVRALWQAGGDCADRDPDGPFGDLGFSVPFGEGSRLFVLACGMPGAYNYPSRLYSFADGADTADVVPLPTMGDQGPGAELSAWNVEFSGDRLRTFFKGRGIGDCGLVATWRIDGAAGMLSLTEAREKAECDGEGGDPDSWPLVWPGR